MATVRNEDCSMCDLYTECKNTCLTNNYTGKEKLMIIADYPTSQDDTKGEVMASKKDEMLIAIIEDILQIPKSDYYLTYRIKCAPKNPDSLEATQPCYKYLMEEIELINPKAILALGNDAM